ncbi:hypothetical protein [Pseudomonas sp. Q1-7]|uniref:hypothetical protein n=1 Tax=Pseudomonas sp. Q1-7 TaxID=3020843 RepID=UPI002301C796|nr:hypothetical protein [Pseudomonas sp. Q1-7]
MPNSQTLVILNYFSDCYKELKGHSSGSDFRSFNSRILLAIYSEMTFPGLSIEADEMETHTLTSKLSEAWFAYETLLPNIVRLGFESEKPEKIKSYGSASTIQEAIALHRNFVSLGVPFGKASTFDDARITDAYLEILMEGSINDFCESIRNITSTADSRDKTQAYLLHLEEHSLGLQKDLLLLSYNAITNSIHTTTPHHVMSIAYAVRNQYVHAGETFSSGIEDLNIKSTLLAACFTFVSQYALIIATQLIIYSMEGKH